MSDGKMARSAAKVGEPLGQKFPKSTFIFENQAEPGAGNNDGDHHDDDDDEDDGELCRGLCPTDTADDNNAECDDDNANSDDRNICGGRVT